MSVVADPVGVSTNELAVEDLHRVGAPELLPARRATVQLQALAGATFIDFPAGWGIRAAVEQGFAAAGIDRRPTIEVADVGACLQLLRAGLGVALLPQSLLDRDDALQSRRLATRITWRVVMALPSNRPPRTAAHAFAELVATARSHP